MGFQKAYLLVEPGSRRIDIWFNPTTLALTNSARWHKPATPKGKEAPLTYLGGQEQALSLKFLFHAEGMRKGADVKAKIEQLRELLKPVDQKIPGVERDRPPTVEFVWGSWTSEPSVVTEVAVTTELFDEDGLPLRAWVALKMSKSLTGPAEAPTNPTTKGTRRRRGHQVAPGENIALIAHEHFRTPTRWKEIAEMNDLDDPLRVQAPRLLIVPLEQDE